MVEIGVHRAILEITTEDYNKVYENQYTNEVATEIIKNHLEEEEMMEGLQILRLSLMRLKE